MLTFRQIINLLITITAIATVSSTTFAFSSKEKSPEELAAEKDKKSTQAYNEGVKHMGKAKEIAGKGDSTYAFNYRATSDAKAKKEYEKAVKSFDEAVKLKANFPEAWNNLGYCYRKIDKLPLSLEAYHKALEFKAEFPEALEYLGETFLAMDSLHLAQGQLEMLKELKSPYADTLMKSIEIYKLAKVNDRLTGTKKN